MDQYSGEQEVNNSSVHPKVHVLSPSLALPPKPEEPRAEDCCGQGCQPCIFDIYQQQMRAWEAECRRLEATKYNTDKAEIISPLRWSPFRCVSVEHEAVSVNVYCFESTECDRIINFSPWQYLVAQSNLNVSISRAYTPLPGKTESQFSVIVKLYEGGLMSEFWKTVYCDEVVLWKGPYETGFHYNPNSYSHIVMFCAGTGLAPCFALAHYVTSNELDETFVRIIFSCRTRNNILLRQPLRKLRENWNFTSKTVLTQDDDTGLEKWYGEDLSSGRITSEVVSSELAGKSSVFVMICGTQSFNKDICGYVRKCGVREKDTLVL
ncbi:NADH-cytochrome b5 reductase-like [Schistocerca gregaria]|uniref:NADH-cytochrome b5 reductase-like n=1 Tax=Schistocerca gregaria TaxID=7010 RepID=UPI00211ED3E0|nr:NADH-cytochrome b5 reductase-like [Schistocerca gregaria]